MTKWNKEDYPKYVNIFKDFFSIILFIKSKIIFFMFQNINIIFFEDKYFKNIYNDYKAVAIDTKDDIKNYPIKATAYIFSICSGVGLVWTNPSYEEFSNRLKQHMNELMTVGQPIRNPYCDEYMQQLAKNKNAGLLKRFSLGFVSFMWVDNYADDVDLYEAQCKYLKVSWLEWKHRIVDVGVLGKWWQLDQHMKDYDINPDEWTQLEQNIKKF